MKISDTDINRIIRLLENGAEIIIWLTIVPREADKARQMRQMSRKLKKKR